jgi:acetyl esterase/lipase
MYLATLDPELAAVLADRPLVETLSEETLAARRSVYPLPLTEPLSERVSRIDHDVRPGGPVVRVHRPIELDGPLPCLYWMHPGGLVLGNRFQDDLRFDVWCVRHRMVAVSVEYRLAPEAPYPAALDDCHDGLRWVLEQADELGVDPSRVGVGGASAGGGLAAALALLTRDRGTARPAFQLLIYPMLDDRLATRSSQADAPVWAPEENRFAWRCYLGDRAGDDGVESYAAAARATDLSGLPPAYLLVGGLDGFLDETVEYATRLLHAGVAADLRVHAGLPHGFDGVAPRAAACRRAQRDLNDWLGRALHPEES